MRNVHGLFLLGDSRRSWLQWKAGVCTIRCEWREREWPPELARIDCYVVKEGKEAIAERSGTKSMDGRRDGVYEVGKFGAPS